MSDGDLPNDGGAPAEEQSPESGPMVVGIGASAGGLKALRTFFEHVPEQSGLAYVVVVHLDPEHESHLADLIQPHVRIPVQQVTETVLLEPDHVYVIPPGANLTSVDTHLRPARFDPHRRERAPIDHFLRTLAVTHDGNAVGVILTGTGSDGALGIKAIKEKAGFTIVQDPGDAEYDGMPRSAVSTGLVDQVLPLAAIPDALLRIAHTRPRVPVPPEGEDVAGDLRHQLQTIFAIIRARTGRDFSEYKRSTLLRRIQRRMQIRQMEELPSYVTLLREDAEEVRALADDILITVTSFFRDPEVWRRLEAEVIPGLFEGKGPQDTVRVWSAGCATGEEAYSLAMLLLEEANHRDAAPHVQVFASDLHEPSLDRAREGFYAGDVEADVPAERLRRFFHKESGGYRVKKDVREHVVFAPHNLLGDPPFSRLDLVACRNLLIYLQRDVQHDVVELFHYALRPDGVLVLGSTETVDSSELFRPEDKHNAIYRKRNVRAPEPRLPVFPVIRVRAGVEPRVPDATAPRQAYGSLHQRLLGQLGPGSILVSPEDRVVHLSERAGRYLIIRGGELTSSAFKLVREELRIELKAALQQARESGRAARSIPVLVQFDGEPRQVVVEATPAREAEQEGFVLVVFDEREPPEPARPEIAAEDQDSRVRDLRAELERAQQRLQTVVEEYETSQEEMKASAEELQSANEELRSTLEELETSKEELQSMNEELQTVNQENRHKVDELSQLSTDLQNLLVSAELATLFLDRDLRILRFTPTVGELFNVRPVDRGRPLSDLTSRLGYPELEDDAHVVLRTLVPVAREVRDERGRWFLTRVLPYRSSDDRIEGVVITFLDISERKMAEDALRQLNETLEQRVAERTRELSDANRALQAQHTLLTIAMEATDAGWGKWDWRTGEAEWSENGKRLVGFESDEEARAAEGWLRRIHPEDRGRVEAEIAAAAAERRDFHVEYRVLHAGGEVRHLLGSGRIRYDDSGFAVGSTGMVVDITERKRAEETRLELLRRLVTAEEDERRRLSFELHDQMGQQITGLLLALRAAQSASDGPETPERLHELEGQAAAIARDIQHMALELRPPALDNLGLEAALQTQIEAWAERHHMEFDFHAVGMDGTRLLPEAETTLYRIVQEALTNVLKHAQATHVSLILERRNGTISVILEDNGAGFDVDAVLASPEKARRLGLRGMRERIALLGGELEVESSPGSGTTIFVHLPENGGRRNSGG